MPDTTSAVTNNAPLGDPNFVTHARQQRAKLKKATQEFEAEFIGTMLKEMRKSTQSDHSLFGSSSEAHHMQEMMDEQMAQHLSKTGAFGLATTLFKSVERTLPPDPDALIKTALHLLK